MKPGTSTTVQEAEQVILEHHEAINRHWRNLVGKLIDIHHKYAGEWNGEIHKLLGNSAYVINGYNAAREYGCNEIEARYFALKL